MTPHEACKPGNLIKTLKLQPYLVGKGPRFTLRLYDTGSLDYRGQTKLAYTLKMGREVMFSGADFAGSPLHCDDSKETAYTLLTFLTLRKGDTDADYFTDYTERQMWFTETHAETLSSMIPEGL